MSMTDEGFEHIVEFKKYCPKCEYRDEEYDFFPCNDCFTYSSGKRSSIPLYFKESDRHA